MSFRCVVQPRPRQREDNERFSFSLSFSRSTSLVESDTFVCLRKLPLKRRILKSSARHVHTIAYIHICMTIYLDPRARVYRYLLVFENTWFFKKRTSVVTRSFSNKSDFLTNSLVTTTKNTSSSN